MSVRPRKWRDRKTGATKKAWTIDVVFKRPGKRRIRVREVSPVQTKRGAEEHERQIRGALLDGSYFKEEAPTFDKWFNGKFWADKVVAKGNKPSTIDAKRSIYNAHLKETFGAVRLDKIDDELIAKFKRILLEKGLSRKTINNNLVVLSAPLRLAAKRRLIPWAPEVGLYDTQSPPFHIWEFADYKKFLVAARKKSPTWYAVACLTGEAGLRIGEVVALDWQRDVDLLAKTLTVNAQTLNKNTGTPKGTTRRTVPMTDTLVEALRGLDGREGSVVSGQCEDATRRGYREITEEAGLPNVVGRKWHTMRHTFATDCARFGVNPWTLQHWLGHKDMDETHGYVDYAKAHARPIPEEILKAAQGEADPDRRVIKMLGARLHKAILRMQHERRKTLLIFIC